MMKVIILRKIHVTMNSFALPLTTIEKTKHIYSSSVNLLYIVLE